MAPRQNANRGGLHALFIRLNAPAFLIGRIHRCGVAGNRVN
jgi:hypothetical protein